MLLLKDIEIIGIIMGTENYDDLEILEEEKHKRRFSYHVNLKPHSGT